MSLDVISKVLADNIARAAFAADNQLRGEKVAKFRRYQDGDHDAQMTAEMRNALRVTTKAGTPQSAPFNSNQMDDVITTMTDRLSVEAIEGDNESASQWSKEILDWNRFDGLQMDVHEGTLRDADSYVLTEYDEDDDMPYLCHELAYDGSSGMIVIHESNDKNEIAAAIKIWYQTSKTYADTMRVAVYYPDRIENFIQISGQSLERYIDPKDALVYGSRWPLPFLMPDGEPIGVPVVQYRNRTRGKGGYGLSELENAIPLQDALNRTLHSMVMTAELSAFPILVGLGIALPAAVTPGMILNVGEGGLSKDQVADVKKIEGSGLQQYIEMANFFIGRIEAVTRTPNMSIASNLSGEAMKQSEIKLIGKVKRFQITAGNAWEDVMDMAARVQTAFGSKTPPVTKRWRTVWADAEIRNDKDVVANAMLVKDLLGEEQSIRNVAPIFKLDEDTIQKIMKDNEAARADRLTMMQQSFNSFKPQQGTQPPALQAQNQQMMNGNGKQGV